MRIALRPTPDLLDLDGWRRELALAESEPDDTVGRSHAIELAQSMVAALTEDAEKFAAEARQA